MIAYVKGVDALYDEADVLMTRPHAEFQAAIKAFNERVGNHPNLFVHMFFPIFENCRNKEFAAQVTLAMLRAGVAYRLAGEAALKEFGDPVLKEPFAFRRFQFGGDDRGFELRSKFHGRGFEEAMIFVERAGPSFQVLATLGFESESRWDSIRGEFACRSSPHPAFAPTQPPQNGQRERPNGTK